MTTPWIIKPTWKGETVAVLASGPSLTPAAAEQLRQHKCIAVNHSHRLAPWADMLVCLDLNLPLWADARGFTGMRVSGIASDDVDALYAGSMFERITLGPMHVIEARNSGLAAIRIAAAMGAAKIILAGFDPDADGYFDGHPAPSRRRHPWLAVGLTAIINELRARGIIVERFAPLPRAAIVVTSKPALRRRGKNV